MKKIILLFIAGAFFRPCLFAQTPVTITLKADPATENFKDAGNASNPLYANNNYANDPNLNAYTWTQSGTNTISRAYIWITLDSIPAGATITSAELVMYNDPNGNPATTGANDFWAERITEPWDESTLNWTNKPATDIATRVSADPFTNSSTKYTIDVTDIISAIYTDGDNYGLSLRLKNEAPYANVVMCSSEHPTASKRPELKITYTVQNTSSVTTIAPMPELTLYPNPATTQITIGGLESNATAIQVFDNLGREVYSQHTDETTLPVENLAPGIYTIAITTNEGNYAIKFMKQ